MQYISLHAERTSYMLPFDQAEAEQFLYLWRERKKHEKAADAGGQ